MILLDSSVLIELFRKKNKTETFFYKLAQTEHDFAISVISHYEIGIGKKDSDNTFFDSLFETITILPFDNNCSEKAIEIYHQLKKNNKLIDLADLLIAATALANNIPLATLNLKHFERISDMEIVSNQP